MTGSPSCAYCDYFEAKPLKSGLWCTLGHNWVENIHKCRDFKYKGDSE